MYIREFYSDSTQCSRFVYIMEYNGIHYQILLCMISSVVGNFLVDNCEMTT